jgi:hypothetical protein
VRTRGARVGCRSQQVATRPSRTRPRVALSPLTRRAAHQALGCTQDNRRAARHGEAQLGQGGVQSVIPRGARNGRRWQPSAWRPKDDGAPATGSSSSYPRGQEILPARRADRRKPAWILAPRVGLKPTTCGLTDPSHTHSNKIAHCDTRENTLQEPPDWRSLSGTERCVSSWDERPQSTLRCPSSSQEAVVQTTPERRRSKVK